MAECLPESIFTEFLKACSKEPLPVPVEPKVNSARLHLARGSATTKLFVFPLADELAQLCRGVTISMQSGDAEKQHGAD